MRGAFVLTFGFALFGCSGKHIVAGLEQTHAQKLESSAPTWCQSTCERIHQCPQGCGCDTGPCQCGGSVADCTASCEQALREFAGGSDFCASIGERLKSCVDAAGCSGLDACSPTTDEEATCKAEVNGSDSGGSVDVPVQNPGAATVTCTAGDSGGSSAPSTSGTTSCQEDRAECSDGHTYGWRCTLGQSVNRCDCLRDGLAVSSFQPQLISSCPTLAVVNAGCGFNLQ